MDSSSFVGKAEIYNKKSKSGLKSMSLLFFQLLVALHVFKETCSREQITGGE